MMFLNSYYRFQPTESQTTHPEPVYVDIGPSTASQENTHNVMCLLPLCDDKVEYAEIKQTEKRGFNADSKPWPGDIMSSIFPML